MVTSGAVVGLMIASRGASVTCEGEAMAIAEASIIDAVEVGFVAGAGGAIGTCKSEEMVTFEAFIIATMVAAFVAEAKRAIENWEEDDTGLVQILLPLAMEVLAMAMEA